MLLWTLRQTTPCSRLRRSIVFTTASLSRLFLPKTPSDKWKSEAESCNALVAWSRSPRTFRLRSVAESGILANQEEHVAWVE
jgi:hypothetical protein